MPSASDTGTGRTRTVARYALSLTLMVLILVVLIHSVEPGNLIDAFHGLQLPYFIAATCLHVFVVFIVSPLLWLAILAHLGCRPPLKTVYQIWIGMFCLRAVLPFKSGGVVGANYLRLTEGLPLTRGIGSLGLMHFMNFYSLWAYLVFGLFWTGKGGLLLPVLLTFVLAAVPVALPWMNVVARLGGRLHPRLGEILGNLISAFTDIPLIPRLLLFGIVLLFQCMDLFVIGFGLRGAGIVVPPADLFLCVPVVYLIANLPITFMGLGTREATLVFVFAPFGSQAMILAAGIGLSFCMEIVPALFSLFYLPKAIAMGLFSHRPDEEGS
ncbi:lysylphosphatidylglycerol synthase transmembrane domain-containing protein [Thermodesulfobacteriota bacterium]